LIDGFGFVGLLGASYGEKIFQAYFAHRVMSNTVIPDKAEI
jgi:hypothetical protein